MQIDPEKLKRVSTFLDGQGIAGELEGIREFAFTVEHAQVSALAEPELQTMIANHLSQEIIKFATEQKMYHLDAIKSKPGREQIDVTYGDDVFHFRASLNDHIFAVVRNWSNMAGFLEFYKTVVPFLPELYRSTVATIESLSKLKITPYNASYRFGLKLSSFKPTVRNRRQRIPNYDLMQRLIDLMHPQTSPFAELNFDQLARTDLKVGAWKEFNGNLRNCWIDIEAPGNQMWSTLEMEFSYQAGTHTDPRGKRSPFPVEMIDEWDVALVDFFRDHILNKFLMSWLKDVTFISVT